MTEKVDKTLIERLIIEHSDRLELEINQKARADAWKFYYRVRVDHVIRPFAVCKVCFRVLHCDSRSGTASLLRHPCNPLSERSPVNRAVKLTAKLNLPTDNVFKNPPTSSENVLSVFTNDHFQKDVKHEPVIYNEGNNSPTTRISPVSLAGIMSTSCPSPTSTGSPPTAAQPTVTAALNLHQANTNNNNNNNTNNNNNNNNNNSRKRKVGGTAPPAAFPLDLRFLQLPQLMAAAAANPFTALFNDPQRLQQLQQQFQQSQLEHILREHQKQLQQQKIDEQERESKRTRGGTNSPSGEPSNHINNNYEHNKIKKETHGEILQSYLDDSRSSPIYGREDKKGEDPGGGVNTNTTPEVGLTKDMVQQLVSSGSPRITLTQKETGSHYISDVWTRFNVVYVDGKLRPYASCKTCQKVVTYTKYSGTGGLLRHRCASEALANQTRPQERENNLSETVSKIPVQGSPPPYSNKRDACSPINYNKNSCNFVQYHEPVDYRHTSSPRALSLITRGIDKPELNRNPYYKSPSSLSPTSAMDGVARALLKYMCNDMVSSSSLNSPAFQQLVWTVLNVGASHGGIRQEESLPSSEQLLGSFLEPLVEDSRCIIAKDLQDLTHLCLSVHIRDNDVEQSGVNEHNSLLATSVHYITSDFVLKSHALGTQRIYPGAPIDDTIDTMLIDFFHEVLPASSVREKHITIVRDRTTCENATATVTCYWHLIEDVLDDLINLPVYKDLYSDIVPIINYIQKTSADININLQPEEISKWDKLLRALILLIAHYDRIEDSIQRANEPRDMTTDKNGRSSSVDKIEDIFSRMNLKDKDTYVEMTEFLQGIRQCLMTIRNSDLPSLNQAVLCRAKLLELCSSTNGRSPLVQEIKDHISRRFDEVLVPEPLHLVASFLDPRCKSLKVRNFYLCYVLFRILHH